MMAFLEGRSVLFRNGLIITGLVLLSLVATSPISLTSQGGPTTTVDVNSPADEDNNCDSHFKTLKAALNPPSSQCSPPGEYTTILVMPGSYDEGKLEVRITGIKIQSSDGEAMTKINGCFEIDAKGVLLQGFDINAANCDSGISVLNNSVQLMGNKVHEAKANGIELGGGSDASRIEGNEIVNNTNFGLHATGGSHGLQILGNKFNSNGSHGIALETNNDFFTVEGNEINLNEGNGIWIFASDFGQITNNDKLTSNRLNGIALENSHGNHVSGNTITGSGLFGISISGGTRNEVRNNALNTNVSGGVALAGGSFKAAGNQVVGNTIQGHNRAPASGVYLEGDAIGNQVRENKLLNNTVGMRFAPAASGSGPSNNVVEGNEISNAVQQGILVEGSFGLNVFRGNKILQNNQEGIKVIGSRDIDELVENVIEGNGRAGIYIQESRGSYIHKNQISRNGGHGIELHKTMDTTIEENTIREGELDGVSLTEAVQTIIHKNTIEQQNLDAIGGTNVTDVVISDNTLQMQRGRGVSLHDCTAPIDMEMNVISSNSLGGVFLSNCKGSDLQMNEITANLRYGLWVEKVDGSQDIQARRNWWGDPKGPAGILSGTANAVIMMGVRGGNSFLLEEDEILKSVMPWLTDRLKEQIEDSVSGFLLRGAGTDNMDLNALGQTDTQLMFSGVDQSDKGIAIVAKYSTSLPSSNSIYSPVEALPCTIKTVGVYTGGFNKGSAVVSVQYTDAEFQAACADGDRAKLSLFYFDPANKKWIPMPGKSLEKVNMVQGEITVELLRQGVIIALAPLQS